MRLDWAILANAAEVREGLVNVLSAGWNVSYSAQFPATFFGAVAAVVLLHPSEVPNPHRVQVQVSDANGTVSHDPVAAVIPGGVVPVGPFPPTTEVPLALAINLTGLPVPAPGIYVVNLIVDGVHLKSMPIQVIQGEPPSSLPRPLGVQGPEGGS